MAYAQETPCVHSAVIRVGCSFPMSLFLWQPFHRLRFKFVLMVHQDLLGWGVWLWTVEGHPVLSPKSLLLFVDSWEPRSIHEGVAGLEKHQYRDHC